MGPTRKEIGNGDPMQSVNYQISLYPPLEDRKIERRVRKTYTDQLRSRKSGKKEGTSKMRNMSNRPNLCQGNLIGQT